MPGQSAGGQQAGPSIDSETARRLFREDLDQVETLLRPLRFRVIDEGGVAEVPLTCLLPDGSDGRSYGFKGREAMTDVEDPAGKAKVVADHWRGKGYQVKERSRIAYEVTARTAEGGALWFIVGLDGQGLSVSGESACAAAQP